MNLSILFSSILVTLHIEGILSYLKCECGVSAGGLGSRIVGGDVADPHEYPWLTAIHLNGEMHCGGALITDRHALSAGHCFKWSYYTIEIHACRTPYQEMTVFMGAHDLRYLQGVAQRRISKAVIHPKFTSTKTRDDHDIAIFTLDIPVRFNDRIIPICLPGEATSFEREPGIVAGWGRNHSNGELLPILNKAMLRVMPQTECLSSSLQRHITTVMFCAFAKGKDGCQGDSGGPLIAEMEPSKFVQIGVVSWGVGCAHPSHPGVYTNISHYLDWIVANTLDGQACSE